MAHLFMACATTVSTTNHLLVVGQASHLAVHHSSSRQDETPVARPLTCAITSLTQPQPSKQAFLDQKSFLILKPHSKRSGLPFSVPFLPTNCLSRPSILTPRSHRDDPRHGSYYPVKPRVVSRCSSRRTTFQLDLSIQIQ